MDNINCWIILYYLENTLELSNCPFGMQKSLQFLAMNGLAWKTNVFMTSFLVPGYVFILFFAVF